MVEWNFCCCENCCECREYAAKVHSVINIPNSNIIISPDTYIISNSGNFVPVNFQLFGQSFINDYPFLKDKYCLWINFESVSNAYFILIHDVDKKTWLFIITETSKLSNLPLEESDCYYKSISFTDCNGPFTIDVTSFACNESCLCKNCWGTNWPPTNTFTVEVSGWPIIDKTCGPFSCTCVDENVIPFKVVTQNYNLHYHRDYGQMNGTFVGEYVSGCFFSVGTHNFNIITSPDQPNYTTCVEMGPGWGGNCDVIQTIKLPIICGASAILVAQFDPDLDKCVYYYNFQIGWVSGYFILLQIIVNSDTFTDCNSGSIFASGSGKISLQSDPCNYPGTTDYDITANFTIS